ncbi:MAG: hypothetical protein A2W23_03895 [Planctomycetes bacterium RBG_16_43_13]|nr:MAG: hypothetical protein A2W23_03895 [Planctomycetes bacterium RBG_16_43_13]
MSKSFRCIAPDIIGFGESDKPKIDYSINGFADFIHKFLNVLSIKKANVLGHSMGGTIAIALSIQSREIIDKLILVNPVIKGKDAFSTRVRMLSLPIVRSLTYLLCKIRTVRRWIAKDIMARMDDELIDDIARGGYRPMVGGLISLQNIDFSRWLKEAVVPILIVTTDRDKVVRNRQDYILRDGLCNVTIRTISGAGHCVMLEAPEKFNRIVEEFLNG